MWGESRMWEGSSMWGGSRMWEGSSTWEGLECHMMTVALDCHRLVKNEGWEWSRMSLDN